MIIEDAKYLLGCDECKDKFDNCIPLTPESQDGSYDFVCCPRECYNCLDFYCVHNKHESED